LGRTEDLPVHEPATTTLRLFVQKVEYLDSLSFVRALDDPGSKLRLSFNGSRLAELKFSGPDREQIDAFVNTMRLFMQCNDRLSIANMSRMIDGLPLSEELKGPFAECRAILNDHLDSRSSISLDEGTATNRRVLDTVLYGELSHTNTAARERYLRWTSEPLSARCVEFEFVAQASAFLKCLRVMARTCRRMLEAVGEGEQTP
jgi:hypothetical protein